MSVSTRELISKFLEQVRNDIIQEHLAQGQRVTGRTLESLEISVNDSKGVLYGAGYIGVLEDGRRPGKFPPVSKIEQWIKDRGIIPNGKISIASLAYLMARKISLEGTNLYRSGGKSGVISRAIDEQKINAFIESVADVYQSNYASEIIDRVESR